jgi:hypothetical protein
VSVHVCMCMCVCVYWRLCACVHACSLRDRRLDLRASLPAAAAAAPQWAALHRLVRRRLIVIASRCLSLCSPRMLQVFNVCDARFGLDVMEQCVCIYCVCARGRGVDCRCRRAWIRCPVNAPKRKRCGAPTRGRKQLQTNNVYRIPNFEY